MKRASRKNSFKPMLLGDATLLKRYGPPLAGVLASHGKSKRSKERT